MRNLTVMACLFAAGCAPVGPTSGLPSVATSAKPGVAAPLAQGETALIVRTVAGSDPAREIAGAACVADSAYFSASFTAPARVLLPDFGANSPVVTVTCRMDSASGSLAARPTAWSGRGGLPAVGVSVGTGGHVGLGVGWYGGSTSTGPAGAAARYPELQVPLTGA